MGKFAADRGPDLRQLLSGTEAVEPRHQRRVQACRDRQRRRRDPGCGLLRFALALGFEHGLGHLFDEQRNAVGAFENVLKDSRR